MIPGSPDRLPRIPNWTLMKIDPRYVMGNRPRRWCGAWRSYSRRDLLLFSINRLPVSVYNLNSSFSTRLSGYFQSLFSENTVYSTPLYFSLFLYSTITLAWLSTMPKHKSLKDFFKKARKNSPEKNKDTIITGEEVKENALTTYFEEIRPYIWVHYVLWTASTFVHIYKGAIIFVK
jgi:hypothetical protein